MFFGYLLLVVCCWLYQIRVEYPLDNSVRAGGLRLYSRDFQSFGI